MAHIDTQIHGINESMLNYLLQSCALSDVPSHSTCTFVCGADDYKTTRIRRILNNISSLIYFCRRLNYSDIYIHSYL